MTGAPAKLIAVLLLALSVTLPARGGLLTRQTLYYGDDLEALCSNKSIDLNQVSQIQTLVFKFEATNHGAECNLQTRTALFDLKKLVTTDQNNVCSMEKAMAIREFYLKHLDQSSSLAEKSKVHNSLRRFALAYGLQVSSICKKKSVNLLTSHDLHKLFTSEDQAIVERWFGPDSPVGQLVSAGSRPDQMVLPLDLAAVTVETGKSSPGGIETFEPEQIVIQVKTSKLIEQLKETCQHRFQPIYAPLLLPLIQLSKVGFSFRSAKLKEELKKETTNTELTTWARVVFLCESLNQIELVESASTEAQPGNGVQQVSVLIKDETQNSPLSVQQTIGVEPVHFELQLSASVGDVVLVKSDKLLMDAISSFNTNLSELQRLNRQVLWKSLSTVVAIVKKHGVRVFLSESFKMICSKMRGEKPIELRFDPNTSVIKSINQLVDNETNLDELVGLFRSRRKGRRVVGTVVGAIAVAIIIVGATTKAL